MDPFVVYGDAYKSLRMSVSGAIHGDQMDDLQQSVQVFFKMLKNFN